MKKDIERGDYLKLLEVFASHPDFRTETDRWGLITHAFGGIPGAARAMGNLNLAGHAQNAAVALVDRLLEFGPLGDRQSLSLVLDALRARAGDDQQTEMGRLIAVLDGQGAAPRPSHPDTTGRQADILHLSDLHFGSLDDAQRLHSQLAEDLKRDLGCTKLDGMILSGDMTMVCSAGFVERLAAAGFRLALHGHIHKAENGQYRYDQIPGRRRMEILAAGTFGAPSRQWVPGYPAQYQLLRFDGPRLSVETRRREEQNGSWRPDACWLQGPGEDPLPRYSVDL